MGKVRTAAYLVSWKHPSVRMSGNTPLDIKYTSDFTANDFYEKIHEKLTEKNVPIGRMIIGVFILNFERW